MSKKSKAINQQLIADRLKLSRATVSRCFTNHPGINPQTRAKVFELASQLGYHHMPTRTPNGRRLTQRTTFGVLICSDQEEYERRDYDSPGRLLLKGISEYSQVADIGLSVHFIDPAATCLDDPAYSRLLKNQGRDWNGILLMYPFPKAVVDSLMIKYPCVSLVEQRGAGALNCVDVDHYQGIAQIVNHLHQRGHRRIAFYSKYYKVEASWSLRRCGAYFEKMTQLGLRIRDQDMINAHPRRTVSLDKSFDLAADRVAAGVTAIVCAADHQAYDLISGLEARGVRVPDDVSITGFDGIKTPRGRRRLSTVEIPYNEIGYTATKRLEDLLKKRFAPSQHILLGCQFRGGETTAATAAAGSL